MTRVALVLAYDGTSFEGWQRQDGSSARTVQGELEHALSRLTGAPVGVHGASRTDSGVHARMQVAHADLVGPRSFPPDNLRYRLNGMLAADLRVRAVVTVPEAFHARVSATGKSYAYRLRVAPVADPFSSRFALHVPRALDLGRMRAAARHFEGERDFAALRSLGSSARTTVRRVTRCAVVGDAPELRLEVEGTGFLRHMVRALAGCLLEVGHGRREPGWVAEVLASADRGRAAANAPAHGLCLERVAHEEPFGTLILRALDAEDRFSGSSTS